MAQRKTATKSGKSRQSTKTKPSKTASHKAKATAHKQGGSAASKPHGFELKIDRRRNGRRGDDRGDASETPVLAVPKLERRQKVNRRRQIDPTTCERDYSDDEIQFMNALDAYKRASGRMFPTCSEVLEVLRSLGYVRLSSAETKAYEAPSFANASAGADDSSDQTDTDPSP